MPSTNSPREVTLIARITSRHGPEFNRRLQDELPKRGITIVEAHMVRRRADLKKRIRQAVKSGKKYIVVVGGDGTQTAAVAELARTDSVLCVVPAGTGNSFALSIGIKADIEQAIETIVNGKELKIDVGSVNGEYFANFATIGLVAEAAVETPKPLKRVIGPLAYAIGFLKPLFRHGPFQLRVKWPKNDLKLTTYQAILSAGRFYGWKPLTPNANVRSGELAFFCTEGHNSADVIKVNAALVLGQQTHVENAHYFSATEITISAKPKQPINIDGHACGKTPGKFKVERKALRVLVPRDFDAEAEAAAG